MLKNFPIKKGLVLGHVSPDADSICSGISMTKMLVEHGKVAKFWVNNVPRQYDWIIKENKDFVLQGNPNDFADRVDYFYVMDCEPSDARTDFYFPHASNIVNIDHHWHRIKEIFPKDEIKEKNNFYGEYYYKGKPILLYLQNSVSTSSIMANVFDRKDDLLALGIYFDSSELTVKSLDSIKTIASLDIDEDRLDHMIKACTCYGDKEDWTALINLKTWWTQDSAMCLCYDTAKYSDWHHIIKTLERYFTIVIFIHKNGNVSLRTRSDIDLSSIATNYGGGGHKGAAGFRVNKDFKFLEFLKKIKNENFNESYIELDSQELFKFIKEVNMFLKGKL